MVNSKGYRRGTRDLFARDFRKHGTIPLSKYLEVYKIGDFVDIKVCIHIYSNMNNISIFVRSVTVNTKCKCLKIKMSQYVRCKIRC